MKIVKIPKENLDLFVSVLPAFGEVYAPVRRGTGYAFDRPSVWSLLWHGGISSTEFRWDMEHLAPADTRERGLSAHPAAYYCPMRLLLNHHPSLDLTLVVTAPHSPLLSCAGMLSVLAEKPGDKQVYLNLRIVSARRSGK